MNSPFTNYIEVATENYQGINNLPGELSELNPLVEPGQAMGELSSAWEGTNERFVQNSYRNNLLDELTSYETHFEDEETEIEYDVPTLSTATSGASPLCDLSIAVTQFELSQRVAIDVNVLSPLKNKKAIEWNISVLKKLNINPLHVLTDLQRYVDLTTIKQTIDIYNIANPSLSIAPGVAPVDAVFAEAVHQFQKKVFFDISLQNGNAGKNTLHSLGIISFSQKAEVNSYAKGEIQRLNIKLQLNGKECNYTNWYNFTYNPSVFGITFNRPVHYVLIRQLRIAETYLFSLPRFKGDSLVKMGAKMGLSKDTEKHAGGRSGGTGMHTFGLAIDINHANNPFIGAGWIEVNSERTKMLEVLKKASGLKLYGSKIAQYLNHLGETKGADTYSVYDELKQRNDEFKTYLNSHPAELAYWRKSRTFQHGKATNGFLNLDRDLVYALRQIGNLAWGAIDFGAGDGGNGDIMHFDMRALEIGRTINLKKSGKHGGDPLKTHPYLLKGGGELQEVPSLNEVEDFEIDNEEDDFENWEEPESDDPEYDSDDSGFEIEDYLNDEADLDFTDESIDDYEGEMEETHEEESDGELTDSEFPSIYPAKPGVSPFALQAKKQWKKKSGNDLRPLSWRGKVYGLVVHTTGGKRVGIGVKKGVYPTIEGINYYFNTYGCHYLNGWKGIMEGDLVQLANENKEANGVVMKEQIESIENSRFEKDLPATLSKLWKAKWPGYKNPIELLPNKNRANACYIHIECLPVVYYINHKTFIDKTNPPMRPGLRFTKAQHDSIAILAYDIANRNGWPMNEQWWKTPRLLGHEDLSPISRKDSNGGYDPGGRRTHPYFDWDYVYQQIENIHKNGYASVLSYPIKITSELKDAYTSHSVLFEPESEASQYTYENERDSFEDSFESEEESPKWEHDVATPDTKDSWYADWLEIVSTWGSKEEIAKKMGKLMNLHLPDTVGKPFRQLDKQQQAEYLKIWETVKTSLFNGRKALIANGFIPKIGKAKIPFGFHWPEGERYHHKGLGNTKKYLTADRLDLTLLSLFTRGKITITQDQLDIFQRIANVETGGVVQVLNSYDSTIITIGFMQLTLQHGKVQEWIRLAPAAFKRYGIELHPTEKYHIGDEKQSAILGVSNAHKADLRWNGWAERFYYAGLDEEIIIAEVNLSKTLLERHLADLKSRLKKRLKNDSYYHLFVDNYYNNDPYIRGLFHASINNRPASAVGCVYKAIGADKTAPLPAFLKTYKEIVRKTNEWQRLVRETSTGTSLILPAAPAGQPEFGYNFHEVESEESENEENYESYEDEFSEGYAGISNQFAHEDDYFFEENNEQSEGSDEEDYFTDESEIENKMDEEEIEMESGMSEDELDFTNDISEEEIEMANEMSEEEIIDEIEASENYEHDGYKTEYGPGTYEVSQIPTSGLTEYLDTTAVKGYALKTGIFIPPGFIFSADINIVLYLHGMWENGYNQNGIQAYWNKYSNLRAHFFLGGRNAILIAPLLGKDPEKSSHVFLYKSGFDNFIASCFAELKKKKCIPGYAQPNRIILAAHSAGGKPMSIILNSKSNQLVSKIDECWGFDCLYGYDFVSWLKRSWLAGKINNHKFYHYWAYTKDKKISKPGYNGDVLQKEHPANMFNIAPKEQIHHQEIIQYAWRNEINKRPWFDPIPSFGVPVSKELPPISDWVGGAYATTQAHTCKAAAMPATFTKTHFSVSKDIAEGATKSSYDFTRQMIRVIGEDPDAWYNNFIKTTFLGVSFGNPIHIELANLLKNIETKFIDTIDPVNRNICNVRQKLGINSDTFSGGRTKPTAALKSMHLFGLALDVNITGNCFVQNKAIKYKKYTQPNGVTTINSLLSNADKLSGGKSPVFQYHLSYDVYVAINTALTTYLKLLDNDSLLQHALSSTTSSDWKSLTLATAKQKIQKDLNTLAIALVRWGKRDELKNNGFLNLSKEFVNGMIAGGLDWGGSSYGDMMHFDMRTTGVGKKIHEAIARS